MKSIFLLGSMILTAVSSTLDFPEVPFQYQYEIVSRSRNPKDITELYYYKEKMIDTYEKYFMPLGIEKMEPAIKNNLMMFSFDEDARVHYISGTIVVLLGDARGVEMKGELRRNECDETVIREKIFILDLFS